MTCIVSTLSGSSQVVVGVMVVAAESGQGVVRDLALPAPGCNASTEAVTFLGRRVAEQDV